MVDAVSIKTKNQIEIMRESGKILRDAHILVGERLKEGMTTADIDKIAYDFIIKNRAKPSFLGYGGFKGTACVSINEQLLHGIPSGSKLIKNGDTVKIDLGVLYKGFHTDAARTYAVGECGEDILKMIECAEQAFFKGAEAANGANRLGDVCHAIGAFIEKNGYGIVRDYIGHGVGQRLHEPPDIPNYGIAGRGIRLRAGMTFAIEPMITMGGEEIKVLNDGWTVVTKDGGQCAHYENTILVTDNGAEILTL
jgi:methionyl aminopeptidase